MHKKCPSTVAILSLLVVAMTCRHTAATTIARLSFDDLVKRAGSVVDATVVSRESRRDDQQNIHTYTTLDVHEWIVGEGDIGAMTLRHLGGAVDGEIIKVDSMPELTVGKRYVLFLQPGHRGICPILGWRQGCFHVNVGDGGESPVVADSDDAKIRGIAAGKLIRSARALNGNQPALSLDQFKQIIKSRRQEHHRDVPREQATP